MTISSDFVIRSGLHRAGRRTERMKSRGMDSGIDGYVRDLASQGARDSEGVFTLCWEKAVGKLKTFQAGDHDAFLLFLVSAGCSFGARNISIEESARALDVVMHGTYLTEADIRRGFDSIATGKVDSDALDLGMGLHVGLQGSVHSVVLFATHPVEPSFRWTLTSSTERANPLPGGGKEARVTVSFQKAPLPRAPRPLSLREWLFGRKEAPSTLGGYAGMSEPCRRVDRRCDRSPIPITVNSQLVSRPVTLPTTPVAAKVGSFGGVRFRSSKVLQLERDWSGALAFQSGPLHFVVNGVAYPRVEHPRLTGTVWCRLNRDLSRQRIVKDAQYDQLMAELDQLCEEMALAEREL